MNGKFYFNTDYDALRERLLHGSDDHETSMALRQEAAALIADLRLKRDAWSAAAMTSENERQVFHAALTSIANSACCEGCQEVSMVAKKALRNLADNVKVSVLNQS